MSKTNFEKLDGNDRMLYNMTMMQFKMSIEEVSKQREESEKVLKDQNKEIYNGLIKYFKSGEDILNSGIKIMSNILEQNGVYDEDLDEIEGLEINSVTDASREFFECITKNYDTLDEEGKAIIRPIYSHIMMAIATNK